MEAVGRVSYRFRQQSQVVLLALSLAVTRPLGSPRAETLLLITSALLVFTGGALRSWAMGYHTWRRVRGQGSKRRLITAGPYRITRNPLYLGSFLVGCGVAAMSGWLGLLFGFAAVFLASHYCIIRWEERRLEAEFAESFRRYASWAPRFFPGLRAAPPAGGAGGPAGRFDRRTMIRCMEPVKTVGFVAAVFLMDWLRSRGWTPVF